MLQTLWQWLRRRATRSSANDDQHVSTDYAQDRETNRLAHMSDEDRAWESASLQRERNSRERSQDA